jgi:hypothetical protein
MATAIQPDEEQTVPDKLETLTLDEILTENVNLADFLTDNVLNDIGQKVIRDIEIDESSREDWLKRYRKWLDMAMQVRETKNFPWPKASNVKLPLLTVAAIQFQARAYPAIVDGANLVKGRVLGPDPDGQKHERADRIGAHMTWQLLHKMPGMGGRDRSPAADAAHYRMCVPQDLFRLHRQFQLLGDGLGRGLHHQLLGQEPRSGASLHPSAPLLPA